MPQPGISTTARTSGARGEWVVGTADVVLGQKVSCGIRARRLMPPQCILLCGCGTPTVTLPLVPKTLARVPMVDGGQSILSWRMEKLMDRGRVSRRCRRRERPTQWSRASLA